MSVSPSSTVNSTRNSTTPRGGRKAIAVRAGLALATAAGVAAGITGLGLHAADAASTHPFGTTNLIQSQDFGAFKDNVGELNAQTTQLYGARSVSACTGEDSLDEITGNKNLTSIGSQWFSDLDDGTGYINETIVQAKLSFQNLVHGPHDEIDHRLRCVPDAARLPFRRVVLGQEDFIEMQEGVLPGRYLSEALQHLCHVGCGE